MLSNVLKTHKMAFTKMAGHHSESKVNTRPDSCTQLEDKKSPEQRLGNKNWGERRGWTEPQSGIEAFDVVFLRSSLETVTWEKGWAEVEAKWEELALGWLTKVTSAWAEIIGQGNDDGSDVP